MLISQFFRDLCSSTIKIEDMIRLEKNIQEILCKLVKIFPPSFFNSMEHLPIHLPTEAKLGGPVQYRWMYPYERFLNHLKCKVGNKARVEGSICNAYLSEDTSNFCSLYFEDHIDCKAKDLTVAMDEQIISTLPEVFQSHGGNASTKGKTRRLTSEEYDRAHLYVLSECEGLKEYERLFETSISQKYPQSNLDTLWSTYEKEFPEWFQEQDALQARQREYAEQGVVIDENGLFFDLSGGFKKGHVLGLGNAAKLYYKAPSQARASSKDDSFIPGIVSQIEEAANVRLSAFEKEMEEKFKRQQEENEKTQNLLRQQLINFQSLVEKCNTNPFTKKNINEDGAGGDYGNGAGLSFTSPTTI